jgi:hypothetical protein
VKYYITWLPPLALLAVAIVASNTSSWRLRVANCVLSVDVDRAYPTPIQRRPRATATHPPHELSAIPRHHTPQLPEIQGSRAPPLPKRPPQRLARRERGARSVFGFDGRVHAVRKLREDGMPLGSVGLGFVREGPMVTCDAARQRTRGRQVLGCVM